MEVRCLPSGCRGAFAALVSAGVLAILPAASPLHAQVLTLVAEGEVNLISCFDSCTAGGCSIPFSVGDLITMTYAFESSTPDAAPADPEFGQYSAVSAISVTVGTYTATGDDGTITVARFDTGRGLFTDMYAVASGTGGVVTLCDPASVELGLTGDPIGDFLPSSASLELQDRLGVGGSFPSDALPASPLDPADFSLFSLCLLFTNPTTADTFSVCASGFDVTGLSGLLMLGESPDTDGDGVSDAFDNCPAVSNPSQTDGDGDGAGDVCDVCPNDPSSADTDGDGTPDCIDVCPLDPDKDLFAGECGCGTPETDSDSDGTPDCNDGCPDDPGKTDPGLCGCGTPETDTDSDGTPDCDDGCPDHPDRTAAPCEGGDDADGDGVLDPDDACPATPGLPDRQGCPVGDFNLVELHVIDQAKSGACPGGAGSCKFPIAGAEVRVFDRDDSSFQAAYGTKNPSGTRYVEVFENDIGRVGACNTGANGECTAGEETIGDYLVIVRYFDAETGKTIYTGKPKSPEDFVDNLASKDFQVIKVLKKDGSIQLSGGAKTVVTGSYLEIIYPDSVVWDDPAQGFVYPYVFRSDSDWTVDICAEVPAGYEIAGIYDENGDLVPASGCAQTFVSGEVKVVAFDVVEVGSPEPSLRARLRVKGGHAGRESDLELHAAGLRTYQVVESLTEAIEDAHLPANIARPLLAMLDSAVDAYGRGRYTAGDAQVRAFRRLVLSSRGVLISEEIAELLLALVYNIIPENRRGGGGGKPHLFLRADANGDGTVSVADSLFTLGHLFLGESGLSCEDAADTNDDGRVDISDSTCTLSFLFRNGPEIPPPYPEPGVDSTPDDLRCE